MNFKEYKIIFDKSFSKVEPDAFINKMKKLGYKFKNTTNMKKIIGYLPTLILYHLGTALDAYDTVHNNDNFGACACWCMEKSFQLQEWTGAKNPGMIPEPKKNLEIERRWLLKCLPSIEYDDILYIKQYYTSAGRFRVVDNKCNFTYYHTIKKTIAHGINEEDEHTITKEEFDNAIKSATSYICKQRYKYKYDGLVYEFDGITFDNSRIHPSLCILEIELKDIKQIINMPYNIKILIIKEITGESLFSNHSLSTKLSIPVY